MLDQTRKHEILSWMHGGGLPPAITALIRTRLMTVNGTATANGTEVATGGGYTAGAGAPTIASWAAPASGAQATSAAVSVSNYPRAESVVGIELWDSTATPKRVELGSHTAKAMAAGDTLTYASGAITSTLNDA